MQKGILFVYFSMLFFFGCSSDTVEHHEAPVFKSSIPENGAENVSEGDRVEIVFDEVITLKDNHGITVNGVIAIAKSSLTKVVVDVALELGKQYEVKIPSGSVINTFGVASQSEIVITFKTRIPIVKEPKDGLVVSNPSAQAVKLFNFLNDNYGKKIISGTHANVSWNINEAEWVKQHTGKYPALNGFDLIHLYASPANWIDYSNISVVENWWNDNGLVHLSWHWNVPSTQGGSDYEFYTKETSFDIREAVKSGTWQNQVIMNDLAKAADVLKLLRDANIPVLWRPLHEAAGGWFWWGAKGAEPCKQLWKIMFDYFESQELNNLIWIWTVETGDDDWYPGDEYVDMIGRDVYNKTSDTWNATHFNSIQETYPNHIIALSECGNVADIASQWNAGATWSFFMIWYDYNRTVNTSSAAFTNETHEFANAAWWRTSFESDAVITLDKMPNLK
jgi:mannan endo-1,4-beta-mannosidase